eukprot:1092732-Amphidinium_carterae.1
MNCTSRGQSATVRNCHIDHAFIFRLDLALSIWAFTLLLRTRLHPASLFWSKGGFGKVSFF